MMKPPTCIALWILVPCLLVAGFVGGTLMGYHQAMRQVRIQLRADLFTSRDKADPLLTEYIKARYYYFSCEAGVRLREGEEDHGPINESLLQGFTGGKGPTSFKEAYENYRKIPGFAR